jgi:hypothetical protein
LTLNDYAIEGFKWKEFACKGYPHCDCHYAWKLSNGITHVKPIALMALEQLRRTVDKPLIITSACRCPAHNKREGGSKKSYHISTPENGSTVFDISTNVWRYQKQGWTAPHPQELKEIAASVGFNGIGMYKTWIHVDVRDKIARW